MIISEPKFAIKSLGEIDNFEDINPTFISAKSAV